MYNVLRALSVMYHSLLSNEFSGVKFSLNIVEKDAVRRTFNKVYVDQRNMYHLLIRECVR